MNKHKRWYTFIAWSEARGSDRIARSGKHPPVHHCYTFKANQKHCRITLGPGVWTCCRDASLKHLLTDLQKKIQQKATRNTNTLLEAHEISNRSWFTWHSAWNDILLMSVPITDHQGLNLRSPRKQIPWTSDRKSKTAWENSQDSKRKYLRAVIPQEAQNVQISSALCLGFSCKVKDANC